MGSSDRARRMRSNSLDSAARSPGALLHTPGRRRGRTSAAGSSCGGSLEASRTSHVNGTKTRAAAAARANVQDVERPLGRLGGCHASPFAPTRLADGFGEGVTGRPMAFYTPRDWVPRSEPRRVVRYSNSAHQLYHIRDGRVLNGRKFLSFDPVWDCRPAQPGEGTPP